MIHVLNYLDYRAFLRDTYESVKKEKPFFSFRYISGRVGINPGYVVKVLQGKVHLGVRNIPAFADLLGLQGKERDYFTELVFFGRAKSQRDIEMRMKRLITLKGVSFRTVADDQVEFYRHWHHMAIRSLLSIYPFTGTNYRDLASKLNPRISVTEARESVRLLERLKMIRKDDAGVYRVAEQYISTGEKWAARAIREYQKVNIALAARSLDNCSKDLRDISTVTMTFSLKDLPALRERVAQFRQELLQMSNDCCREDSVVQLNIQFFPVAILGKDGKK